MITLGMAYGTGSVMAKTIAERNDIPLTYLEHLLMALRKADLIQAIRGQKGGYILSRPPLEINLYELINALEGSIKLTDCPSGTGCCGAPESCAAYETWTKATNALREAFEKESLHDLVERHKAKMFEAAYTFSI